MSKTKPRVSFFEAASVGDMDALKFHMGKPGNIDRKDPDGRPALHLALWNEKYECATALLSAGANATSKDPEGYTPILIVTHGSPRLDNVSMLRLLVEKGANVNEPRPDGYCALHIASVTGNLATLDFLLRNGSAVNQTDTSGMSALHFATEIGHARVVQALLEHGACVHLPDRSAGRTALHMAALQGYVECCRLLLNAGAKLDTPDDRGNTAMDLVYNDSADVKELLLAWAKAHSDGKVLKKIMNASPAPRPFSKHRL